MTDAPRKPAPTALDALIEQTVGDLAGLHHDGRSGLLSPERASLAAAHRDLGRAETAVAYHRNVLMQLASGAQAVDDGLLDRIRRTVRDLAQAAAVRDEHHAHTTATLDAVRASAPPPAATSTELTAREQAVLLSLAGGGTLRQHLHTHRVSIRTAKGNVVDYPLFQRLAQGGLVTTDTSRALIAGQPVTLTDAGRSALVGSRQLALQQPATPTRVAGAWPSQARSR